MNVKILFCLIFCCTTIAFNSTVAQPRSPNQELRDLVLELRHKINNQETEFKVLEEKMAVQEQIYEALVRDQASQQKSAVESSKSKNMAIEQRIATLENQNALIAKDLVTIKQAIEKQNNVLLTLHERLAGYENALATHGSNVSHLQIAMSSLSEALQMPNNATNTSSSTHNQTSPMLTYVVQPGDSLGRIAIKFNTTANKIKDENNLSSDKIVIGQKLSIPQS